MNDETYKEKILKIELREDALKLQKQKQLQYVSDLSSVFFSQMHSEEDMEDFILQGNHIFQEYEIEVEEMIKKELRLLEAQREDIEYAYKKAKLEEERTV